MGGTMENNENKGWNNGSNNRTIGETLQNNGWNNENNGDKGQINGEHYMEQ